MTAGQIASVAMSALFLFGATYVVLILRIDLDHALAEIATLRQERAMIEPATEPIPVIEGEPTVPMERAWDKAITQLVDVRPKPEPRVATVEKQIGDYTFSFRADS